MSRRITKEKIILSLLNTAFYRSAGATSLGDIAEDVGIKKASLYNHFESREDLLAKTTEYCAAYIHSLTFIPADIEAVAKRYPPETIFKGIVTRYLKMHEKTPLFQVYTFVESQKYFSKEAADIFLERTKKNTQQTVTVLKSLSANEKISAPRERFEELARWFSGGVNDILCAYLLERKQVIVSNPAFGIGELFSVPDEDKDALEKISSLVDNFVSLLK